MALSGDDAAIRELVLGSGPDGEGAPSKIGTGDLFEDDLPSPIWTDRAAERGVTRGPGRPEGSRNRGSEDLVRYLKATRRSPLLALSDVVDMGPHGIMRAFGVKMVDAMDFWRKCSSDLLPYIEKKQPQALELPEGMGAMPVLALVTMPVDPRLAGGNPPAAGDGVLNITDFGKPVEDQALDLTPLPPVSRG